MRSKNRGLGLGLALLASTLAGCIDGFLSSPPTTAGQQDTIAGAVAVALPSCMQLAKGLKPGEVQDLRASLTFVGATLQADGERAQLALTALMTSHNAAAPYAPIVAAVVQIGVNRIPENARASTAVAVAQGVISGCLVGLGSGGTASLDRSPTVCVGDHLVAELPPDWAGQALPRCLAGSTPNADCSTF